MVAAASAQRLCVGAPRRRPNILFVMTDQQFADAMSCRIGKRYIDTPTMDGLAAGGTLFSRAYCSNPLCVPSRASMFTGRYPVEVGIQTNGKKKLDPKKFPCMGAVFRRAGYDTGYVRKWHLPFSSKDTSAHGFGFTSLKGKDDDAVKPAVDFIRRKREKPFLLVASFMNPHNICQWARGEKLPDGAIGRPPALEECPPLKPNHLPPENETDIIALMRRSYQAARLFPVSGFDDRKWREYVWAYYRMVEKVDALIGKVLAALRDSGQEEDTLVVFTSDHGDCHGAHRWNQKTVFYDESTRVPLIVSWKGVTRAGASDRLVNTGVDILPTLCDLSGVEAPKRLRGLSLKGTATGESTDDPREYVVVSNKMVQGAPVDGRRPQPAGRMVRSARYKYCVYDEGEQRESLVDMEVDPGEMTNLAGDPEHAEALARHRRMLAEWGRETGDTFRVSEGT
jgi:choline-sulfatase